MDRHPNQRPRPDTVFSNESIDSIYLQYGVERDVHTDDHGRGSMYNLPGHEASTAALVTPPSNTGSQQPHSNLNGASHILARNNSVRGHRRQSSIASSFASTETLPAYNSSQDNLIDPPQDPSDDSHQANVDRNLSRIYSLYRRDTRSHINSYIPRVPLQPVIGQGVGVAHRQGHHRRQTSDFSLMSNDSNLTLVHSNASHMDVDLEKGKGPHGKSKMGLGLGNESESTFADLDPIKGLPMTPVTPTPKRVLKRTGLCCGLCCFATLTLACICAVSFMMLMVNANMDGWGHRNVVHMPFGFKSPRQTQCDQVMTVEGRGVKWVDASVLALGIAGPGFPAGALPPGAMLPWAPMDMSADSLEHLCGLDPSASKGEPGVVGHGLIGAGGGGSASGNLGSKTVYSLSGYHGMTIWAAFSSFLGSFRWFLGF